MTDVPWDFGAKNEQPEQTGAPNPFFQRAGQTLFTKGEFVSPNFKTGESGWQIDAEGNVEFNDGTFRGRFDVGGTTITISTDDDIQENLDLIEAEGGGTLFLQPGTYTLTADISIPSGVVLQGVSRDGVIIDCNSSFAVTIAGTNPYTTGTIAINSGDTTVVGTGTTFTPAMVGRYIYLNGLWYEIITFTDTTHLEIDPAYVGTNLSGYAYAIADTNFNSIIRKLTIQNATGAGFEIQYANEPWVDDLIITSCGTGIDIDYCVFPKLFVLSESNGVNLNMNYVAGFKVDYCSFSFSTTGAGVVMTNVISSTFFDTAVDECTGDGLNMTSCSGITILSNSFSNNGGQGIELVSGCNDNQMVALVVDGNTSDGIKLTATDDRNTIVACSIINNGGYAINIAASTCDNNQIIAPAFDNNASGNINDSGTGTFISPQTIEAVAWIEAASGGPENTASQISYYINFPDAAQTNCHFLTRVPASANNKAISSIKVYYLNEDGGSAKVVRLHAESYYYPPTEGAAIGTDTNDAEASYTTSGVDNRVGIISLPSTVWNALTATMTTNGLVRINIIREGASGSDTYNTAWKMLGVEVTWA